MVSFEKTALQVHCLGETDKKNNRRTEDDIRVDLLDLKQNKRKTLLEGQLSTHLLRPITLSPDGKQMLISISQKKIDWLFVLNNQGHIIANIKVGKSER